MNDTAQQKPAAKPAPAIEQSRDRAPIPVDKLLFTAPNPHGIKLPDGPEGKGEKIYPNLVAGEHGDVRIEISHRPWLRVFRVVKTKKVTRTGTDAKEVVTWVPMGRPFNIPDNWAVSVSAEE